MLALLLTYRRALLLALCALLGLACGQLAATLLGLRLGREAATAPPRPAAARPAAADAAAADLAFILQHHLFDPAARTKTPPAVFLQPETGETGAGAGSSTFELIGMVAAGPRSIAVLRSGQEINSYRLGETLPGGGTIEEIVRHQVQIRNPNQSLTTLTMYEGDQTATAGVAPATTPAPGGPGDVRAVGENRWVVSRGTAESVRNNLGEQLRLALMQPRMVNGRTDGFIIKKITPGTLLAQMGLKRNDVIRRVNAMTLDTPEKALQILQQLREARQLSIDLERDGQPLSFTYAIE